MPSYSWGAPATSTCMGGGQVLSHSSLNHNAHCASTHEALTLALDMTSYCSVVALIYQHLHHQGKNLSHHAIVCSQQQWLHWSVVAHRGGYKALQASIGNRLDKKDMAIWQTSHMNASLLIHSILTCMHSHAHTDHTKTNNTIAIM